MTDIFRTRNPSGATDGLAFPYRNQDVAERKKLSDILLSSERDNLERLWSTTKPAEDLKAIPRGIYRCRIIKGEVFRSRNGNLGYKLTLQVIEGEHAGRLLWHDVWLTHDGAKYALRDLGKLGVESFGQLENPLPEGIVVNANVVLRRGDDGTERNELKHTNPFDVVGIEPPAPEPYAPKTTGEAEHQRTEDFRDRAGFNWQTGEQQDLTASSRGQEGNGQP
jgi:Protein of unknown function (DUF669)